jgi:hypothetical protein
MLKSLFGDLTLRDPQKGQPDFAATAILDTTAAEVNDRGQIVDQHLRDLFVTGSPAQAMRAHFAAVQDDQAPGTRLVALHDPARMWAASVVKALSDAGGQPIERLHLRDQSTLATLAMIERTTLLRRMDDALKICNADVHSGTPQATDIHIALMERADLACVIVGPLPPGALDELLSSLAVAAFAPTWRCPCILFLLPVGAAAIASKVASTQWPRVLRVQTVTEPLTSASSVWNALLAYWNRIKPVAGQAPLAVPPAGLGLGEFPLRTADIGTGSATAAGQAAGPAAADGAPRHGAAGHAPDPQRAAIMVEDLMRLDGMLYVVVADGTTGLAVAADGQGADLDQAAAAATEVLQTQRRLLRHTGHPRPQDPVDEIVTAVGNRYLIIRTLHAYPDHFVFAALDKLRSNLAMTRFRLLELQQTLG